MSLYPSLEDMTVGKMAQVSFSVCFQVAGTSYCCFLQAQVSQQRAQQAAITQGYQPPPTSSTPGSSSSPAVGGLYPSLEDEYMGLQLTQYRPTQPSPASGAVVAASSSVATRANSGPVSGVANVGIRRAEIKQGE